MEVFKALHSFKHNKEMRESKDEIMFGELIRLMVRNYGPMVELETKAIGDAKQARFRLLNHELLHSVTVKLNRWTGSSAVGDAIFGSKGSLTLVGEVKNYVADPDDVLDMWKTDFGNIAKIPLLGDIKINHQMNSVLATKSRVIELGNFLENQLEERKKLKQEIDEEIREIADKLKQYKKVT